ncbi:IS66 family transposase [Mesorhizobium sp. M0618]|uniref:IS66 family transposase n=1 Tax=unclassified Mesorhizobium TaxID=325217 RepID=UPI00333A9844
MGYYLPYYRQVQMMAAKGVDIKRSTLARSAGYAAALLDPIYNRIREIGRTRSKIHTDDTRLPILAPGNGKTHKGALWVYVADDRNSGSKEPPIAWYRATMGRAGESVMSELAGFAGTLQADGFSGYNQLYKGGAIREAACLAHLRRKIFDVHDSQPTELNTTAMAGIQGIYRSRMDTGAPARRAIGRTTKADPTTDPRAATTAHAPRQGFVAPCRYRQGLAYGTRRWRAFNRSSTMASSSPTT